ncbi:MAG: DUF6605 domain-containing protein [Pirellulaceae bacterium]
MNENKTTKRNRRELLKDAAAISMASAAAGGLAACAHDGTAQETAAASLARNPLIRDENARTGARDWQLTRVRLDKVGGLRNSAIEGYCSKQSVEAGEQIDFMVSTDPTQKFTIEIFRTGYYGGSGARLMTKLGPFVGQPQPLPEIGEKRIRECHWNAATTFTIPDDWPSGVYLGRLTTNSDGSGFGYWQNYVIFIVRDQRPADILLQCSDNTWQAYNQWPDGYSLYTHPKGILGPWADVSFDRPYGKYPQIYENPQSIGSGEWLCFEFPLAYWLEQQGYDVSYCSNSDMLTPDRAVKCKAFISNGHDEYWDIRQFESVVKLRDAGVNLLFLSGNAVCWRSPYRDNSSGNAKRIIYREGPYGGRYKWSKMRNTEHGPFATHGPDEGYLIGSRNVEPINGGGDWICTNPDHWVFAGTGMKQGEAIPGLIGWEYHGDPPTDIPGLEILAEGTALQSGVNPQHWTSTIYPGPKGNYVFNASTIFWCQDLSSPPGHWLPWSHWSRPHGPDRRVQQITHNLLRKAIA